MYVEQTLTRHRQQERIRQAEQHREARQIIELRRLERRQHRAERELIRAWQRVEQLRSTLRVAG